MCQHIIDRFEGKKICKGEENDDKTSTPYRNELRKNKDNSNYYHSRLNTLYHMY